MRALADKNFQLLKDDPRHPSPHFKRIGKLELSELDAMTSPTPLYPRWFNDNLVGAKHKALLR